MAVMEVSKETVDKVQHFAEDRQKAEDFYAHQPITSSETQAYEKRLDETLRELQLRIKHQEDGLRKLRAAAHAIDFSHLNAETGSRVAQVRRAKKAYDSLLLSEADLPRADSSLPPLLAIEETCRIVQESKISVRKTAENLSNTRQRLKTEESNLRDAQAIRDGLQRRIESITRDKSLRKEKSPSQLAHEHVEAQGAKTNILDKDTGRMREALRDFCNRTLAPLIAAEDLGGPVVGDVLDISDATLESGYTRHGRPKKADFSESNELNANQHRIDDMIRRQTGQTSGQPSTKRETAAHEMNELLEALLDAGSSYIELPHESAASRFLVKAKVAQFHPRDARRLRLIDFGRSLSD